MRKIYSFLLTLVLTCVSTVAWGQSTEVYLSQLEIVKDYTLPLNFELGSSYEGKKYSATLEGVYDALGTTAEEFDANAEEQTYVQTAYNKNAEDTSLDPFYVLSDLLSHPADVADGAWFGRYINIDKGTSTETPLEINAPKGWNTGANTFYTQNITLENGKYTITSGQFPETFTSLEDNDYTYLYLVNGTKAVRIKVQVVMEEAPEPTEVYLSKLTIVKDYTLPLNFVLGKSYEGKKYSATLEGVYEALGTTAEEFDANASAQTYVQTVKTIVDAQTEETSYELIDSLSHPEDAAGGAWFGRYANYDEQSGSDIPLAINAPKEWAAGCTFYTQEIALAEGEYTITSGQYPGTFTSTEDNDYTYLYLVNGDKAARIKVQVAMEEAPVIDPTQMVEIGSTNVAVKADVDNNYATKSFTVDMATICEALGCTIDDIDDVYTMSNGGISNDHNESSGGYYYNEEGVITAWGSDAAFFIGLSSLAEGKYTIGQMSGHFTEITEPVTCNAQLVFQYLQNYYSVYVAYTVSQPQKPDIDPSDWTKEYEDDFTVQLIKSEGYGQDASSKTTIDLAAIVEALGTDDLKLFGEKWTEGTMEYSDAYSCDPKPGFWMAEDGISVATWAATCAYGMSYADGVITYYVHPQTSNEAGASFESNFYLVNVQDGKYAKITLNVLYVDQRGEIVDDEILGSQDINIVLSADTYNDETGQYYSPVVDWATAFTTLNMDPQDFEGAIWKVQKKADKFVEFGGTSNFDMETGTMDAKGYYVEDAEKAVFAVGLNISDGPAGPTDLKFTMSLFGNEPEEGVVYATKVALKSEQGIYVFNIVGATEETMTGIKGTPVVKNAGIKFFDFSGREIPAPAKGYAIGTDGKKYYFNK